MATVNQHPISRTSHLRLPKVCVVVIAATAEEMIDKADTLARDNPFVELRLDYLAQPKSALPKIRQFLHSRPLLTALATCRRSSTGGKFRGSVLAELEILAKAAEAGCQLVDLEFETAARLKKEQLQRLREKAALVLSFHDFRGTPRLDQTLEKMCAYGADFYKIAGKATTLYDNVSMMKFLEQHRDQHSLVGLCMGEQGIISRVLGPRSGSLFTFASLAEEQATADGQITAQQLRGTYRVEQLDQATRLYGVAGDPISQSLSPAIMNAALRRENVNGVFLALHTKSLKDLLACIREIPIHGLAVTMPYKQAILPYLDNTDPHTLKIGACNTVVRSQEGKLYGFNTDTSGVVRPLEQRLDLEEARILVIGAGGAARAAVFGLKDRGANVFILNRSLTAGQKLARQAKARTIKRAELKRYEFDVIINATPLGMGNSQETPLSGEEIKAKVVFDMVYDPADTTFLQLARLRGAEVIPGSEMFVQQAAGQFEIWTGKPAPREDMLRIVRLALRERAAARNGHRLKTA
ncbi:MAG: shikimate dehydrogenase [Deltaproteobacteria bacterium]|nr:shikimate dehydrogenase [Deltaproteobacteria bacterium]